MGALTLAAIRRHKCNALNYLPLDVDAVAFNIPTANEDEIIERLRITNIHNCSQLDPKFIISVYVSKISPC